jgi:hypothetical protein
VDLDPHWVEHQDKICGVSFNCPEHGTGEGWCRQVVPFTPAMDGTPTESWQANKHHWQRTGGVYYDDQRVAGFEGMTLAPSVRAGCGWHGFITNGEATCCSDSK